MMTPHVAATAVIPEKDDPTIWRVDDALWALLAPILKSDKSRKKPGRPRRDDRAIFDGLIWLARTGAQWSHLPREFGPKSTVHERFSEWVATGALERAWAILLQVYDRDVGLDWTWQAADGCIVKAPFGKKGALARRKQRDAIPPTAANRAPSVTCAPRPRDCRSPSFSAAPIVTT
jgi:transposase